MLQSRTPSLKNLNPRPRNRLRNPQRQAREQRPSRLEIAALNNHRIRKRIEKKKKKTRKRPRLRALQRRRIRKTQRKRVRPEKAPLPGTSFTGTPSTRANRRF